MQNRRTTLVQLAAAATAAALEPLWARQPPSSAPTHLNAHDYETLSQAVEAIIPKTDTPGAIDAGVPGWIDRRLAADPELDTVFHLGLADLDERARAANAPSFAALPADRQANLLRQLSEYPDPAKRAFFQTLKDMTIDGYYSSEQGLVRELGFHGNTFCPSFPGCTHPEHWPKSGGLR